MTGRVRRSWSIAAVLLASLVSGCGRDAGPAPRPGMLNILMPTDAIDPEIPLQFERVTGERIAIDTYDDAEAALAAGGDAARYDLVIVPAHLASAVIKAGHAQALDLAALPNAQHLMERFRDPTGESAATHSLPYLWSTIGILYRTDVLPEGFDRSWALIYDADRRPGPFLLVDEARAGFATALRHLRESVNTTDPAVIARAGEVVKAAAASEACLGFAGTDSADEQGVDGRAALAVVRSDAAARAMEADEGLGFLVPTEGSAIWVDVMLLPTGAEDAALALRFMDYLLDPQIGAQLANWAHRPTPNQAALPYVEPEQRANPAIYPPDEVMERLEPLEGVGEAAAVYEAAWSAIRGE